MLTLTKLKGAEYLLTAVAGGVEDYYMGIGEAPGVWHGRWATSLGLEGVVEADHLRALVNGHDHRSGEDLLAGHRKRKVAAVDATLSAPKSASLLWAFGSEQVSSIVSLAVVDATNEALGFLEDHAALARRQEGGIRRQVATGGFAMATFAHRTSRLGDPQLHTHCLIPNLVVRIDGEHVAFDANPLHVWAKAAGSVFQNHLQRLLTQRLGVAWGPQRNGTREMVGFSADQFRAFSKRTSAIEARLEAEGELAFDSKAERMRADDRASLATRPAKDLALSPERLRERWATQAAEVGLQPGSGVDDLVVGHDLAEPESLDPALMFAALVDPATGLCANESRFCEAQVVERIAAMSAGAMTTDQIAAAAKDFLATDAVVRLAPDVKRRRPPEWSTTELRAVEDRLVAHLHQLAQSPGAAVEPGVVESAIAGSPMALGDDQAEAVRVLCGDGPAVRLLVAPAGYGKTTALRAAVSAGKESGRTVVVVAPTHKAVAELRAAGMDAQTVARLRRHLGEGRLAPGTTVVVDEVSQLATRDAAVLMEELASCPGAQLWCVGDARQAQSVAAGGLVVELEALAERGVIAGASLSVNRRQEHPGERAALAAYRRGEIEASQAIRAEHGWEHTLACPAETIAALAQAATADADRHRACEVVVLATSHSECEAVADAIRARRADRGELRGPTLTGPGFGTALRHYAAGDRVLVHANLAGLHNGATGTVHSVGAQAMLLGLDDGGQVWLSAEVVAGRRAEGTPNLSHAWARTVDGAQGGTWRQVHLLGSAALDRFRGYVGQSRGQLPTHTWNTRAEADHPAWLLADDRGADEVVLDAMARNEAKSFAAADDPWVLDGQLRAQRQELLAVIATRPTDRSGELASVRSALAHAEEELHWAATGLARRQEARDRLAGVRRLRPGGRDDLAQADDALEAARRRHQRAEAELRTATEHGVDVAESMVSRANWDGEHGWRSARLAEIDQALDRHWAEVTLRAVQADDPLAFGIERLRAARRTYDAELRKVIGAIPPDRRTDSATAEAEFSYRRGALREADRRLAAARRGVEQAQQRRWPVASGGQREHATAVLASAADDRRLCTHAAERANERVMEERQAVETWVTARKEAMGRRRQAEAAIEQITSALRATRPARVAALALDPSSDLWAHLGPPPDSCGGRAAWCGIAERVEAWRDRGVEAAPNHDVFRDPTHPLLGQRPIEGWQAWGQLTDLIGRSDAVLSAAARLDVGQAAFDDVDQWRSALAAAEARSLVLRPDLHRGRGMEL